MTNPVGGTSGRVLAAARFAELTVSKAEDVATIPLIQASLEASPSDAQIDFCRAGTGQLDVYYSISLAQALITVFNQSSAGERPVESVTLNFTQITFNGTQMASDGSGTSPSSYGWNISANQSS